MMNNGLNYAAVLDTARDIASAMAHIHESGILHSDLKAPNIMLKSDGSDPRGFVAKVAGVFLDHLPFLCSPPRPSDLSTFLVAIQTLALPSR